MPIDGHQQRPTTSTKPLTPALSSNLRTRPLYGLTPRLAGPSPTSPASAPARTLRQDTLSPERSDHDKVVSLDSNITPRSGVRRSRFNTESPSTPDAAQSRSEAGGSQQDAFSTANGLGISSPGPANTPTYSHPRSTEQLSFLPTAKGRRISGSSTVSTTKDESNFFRADDVKSSAMNARLNSSRPKTLHFVAAPNPRVSPKKLSTEDNDKPEEKFSYTNHVGNQNNVRVMKLMLATKSSSASIAASSTCSLPTQVSSVRPSRSRSGSETQSHVATETENSSSHSGRIRLTSNTNSTTSSIADRRRSSSLNNKALTSEMSKSHRKSSSTSSAATANAPSGQLDDTTRITHAQEQQLIIDTAAQRLSNALATAMSPTTPRSGSFDSARTPATPMTSVASPTETRPKGPQPQSRHARGSSETTAIQPVTKEQIEAAANARRERKVLDLEISNSSLLAINKTLEKELRKQNTELRRFRRLSRSGRLSLTPANRIVSGASMSTLTTLDEGDYDMNHSTMSPTTSDPGSLDDEAYFNSDDGSSFTQSSDAMRKRARDEKRLMQDLQQHQQILLDSQKLTQSIQRCLNCTDELIKDGTKALAYKVEGDDVQLGGRVLSHDDDEALSEVDFGEYQETMTKPRQGLLSPASTIDAVQEAAIWASAAQALHGNTARPYTFLDKPATESPLPTPELSPVILPKS